MSLLVGLYMQAVCNTAHMKLMLYKLLEASVELASAVARDTAIILWAVVVMLFGLFVVAHVQMNAVRLQH